jgi:hypothetical protein
MIRVSSARRGSGNLQSSLDKLRRGEVFRNLDTFGRRGVEALSRATPVDTGQTAGEWFYEITRRKGYYTIHFGNTSDEDGVNIAVILQYGHGTGTGAYIQGRDYINPAIRPVFDALVEDIWRQVSNA